MRLLIAVLVIICLVYLMTMAFRFIDTLEEENRMLQSVLDSSRIYSRVLSDRIQEIQKFRHDAAGLLQAMETEHCFSMDHIETMPLLDAIIDLKHNQCKKAGIHFEHRLQIANPSELPAEEDLCLVIQNLLDNALDACLLINNTEARGMSLQMKQTEDMLLITVCNRTEEAEHISFRSRKDGPEHGLGLRIVEDVLRRCGGERISDYEREKRYLTTRIQIPIVRHTV